MNALVSLARALMNSSLSQGKRAAEFIPAGTSPAARWIVAFLLLIVCCGNVRGQALDMPGIERAMARRPLDAFTLARREADERGLDAAQVRKLFAAAATIQEKHLAVLSEAQLSELASVYAKTLDNAEAARRVRQDWLKQRERDLGAGDARGRVELARLRWDWLKDRDEAARLCQEALRAQPGLLAAERMLRDDLGYRRSNRGWVPGQEDAKPVPPRVGMSAAEVRDALGLPHRIARQILDGRYLEQWSYQGRPALLLEFDCRKGQEPRVLTVQSAPDKP